MKNVVPEVLSKLKKSQSRSYSKSEVIIVLYLLLYSRGNHIADPAQNLGLEKEKVHHFQRNLSIKKYLHLTHGLLIILFIFY